MTLTPQQEAFTLGAEVYRIRNHDKNVIKVRSVDAVLELMPHLSSVQYPSRLDIAMALANGDVLTANGYTYALRLEDVVGFERNTPCSGGCGKMRSVLHTDDPAQWLCNDCRTKHTHYITMSGTRGCLPDNCNAYETRHDAVDALADLFKLGRTRKARLFYDNYLTLRPQDGAEYCEITACHCDKPWEHCDSGPDPRDWEGYTRTCPNCDGEGKTLNGGECSQCHGDGTIG